MSDWQWFAAQPDGSGAEELTTARDRKCSWKLRDNGDATLTLTSGGDGDQSTLIEELRTDLLVTWQDRLFGRYRFAGSSDTIGETEHSVAFGAIDYRGVLTRRLAHEALSFESVDTAEAGWELIAYAQALEAGHLGIGRGTVEEILTADVEVPTGKSIAEAITDQSARFPGFDWWIDPAMQYQARGFRGTERDFALIYGDTVTAAVRTFEPASYANVVHQTGAQGLTPVVRTATDLAQRLEGRWEAQEGNPDITTQAALNATATTNLSRLAALAPAWTVTVAPGAWTPDDLWVGDLAPLTIRSGRLDVDTVERVLEIHLTDGDVAQVEIVLSNTLRSDLAALQRTVPAQLAQLSRR